ncbi:MAG: CpsD/CapB family tyrosine-protein kinase [Acidobacteriota bacterium]|nr:CpsD/CapB family tyrosine-protein kinase [Acidobacteriota bacterium]
MSRIYDALQRAESERTTERPETENEISEATLPERGSPERATASRSVVDRPVLQRTVKERFAAAASVAESAPASPFAERYASPTEAHVGLDLLDFNKIVARPWSLSLKQLPALLERGSAVEQFRSLRSRLFETRDIKPLKSLLVTSAMPQEGKSFVSTNLALSLARHKNSKVLLIDGDMRRYTVHQLLGCDSQPGLADYLAGKASAVEVMQRPEVPNEITEVAKPMLANLTFIAGGNGGDKAADLSGSPRFGELLQLVAPYFDWIIIDSSPVLPVSDAVNLARSCDGVLLVAREGVTKFQVAQRAQSELKAANLLGFVLNAVQDAPEVGSYYGYEAAAH